MASNREWDRGKGDGYGWAEQSGGWGGQETRGGVRQREDEYHAHDKRRKFNNGGYDNSSYHESQNEHGPGGGGGFGGKKRLQASEASPHVIFLGLDPDFTESDLQAYLSGHGCSVETVTIIRERSSGTSKGFGFAQFPSTEHAKAFVDPLFPFIQVPPPASHGATAKAAFYKALESGAPHSGRRVKIDYSQSASPHERARMTRGNANDGTRDIGNSQAPVLLFRGLDPLSGPQAIHQAMRNSSGFGKEGATGMKRIILIKDKATLASYCFGFVEFVDAASASAVLAASMSPQIHPNGFRISDKPVAASYANPHSFQPVDMMLRDEACLTSSMALGGMEGMFVRYWDEGSTVAVLEFKVDAPAPAVSAAKEKEEKEKKKKKHKEVEQGLVPVAPSALPVSDKPVTLSFNKGAKQPAGLAKPLAVSGLSMGDAEEDSNDPPPADPSKAHTASKTPQLAKGKKIANNISKWNSVQEVLTGSISTSNAASKVDKETPPAGQSAKPSAPSTAKESKQDDFVFSDVAAQTCLLCSRKFNSLDILKRHNTESDLHKKNLRDPALCEVALSKVAAAREKGSGKSESQSKYRDRASERRVLYNQPDVPMPEGVNSTTRIDTRQQAEPARNPTPPQQPAVNPGEDKSNVGNKLLKMMGWTEGSGLGSNADGRVAPVETAIYASGAGLGASKGKDIGKYSGGYLSNAQETARERYNN